MQLSASDGEFFVQDQISVEVLCPDDPVPLDNFWGKTPQACLSDLQAANNPQVGIPDGLADVELMVDPYYPRTIPSVPASTLSRTRARICPIEAGA